jgi:hypothetical protein
MRKEILNVFVLMSIGGILLFSSCGDNLKPDPCFKKKQVKVDFTIGEILNFATDTVLISDTTLANNMVLFKAESDFLSYEWKIGNDLKVFTGKEVKLRFTSSEPRVEIRLIAKWKPDTKCFPNDDGVDTVYKYLTVIDYYKNPILGVYNGYVKSNPTESFDVTVSLENIYVPDCDCSADPRFCGCSYIIRNINKGCDANRGGIADLGITVGYKQLKFNWEQGRCISDKPSCRAPIGWFSLDKFGKDATIKFTTLVNSTDCNQPTDKRINDIFYGTKTN